MKFIKAFCNTCVCNTRVYNTRVYNTVFALTFSFFSFSYAITYDQLKFGLAIKHEQKEGMKEDMQDFQDHRSIGDLDNVDRSRVSILEGIRSFLDLESLGDIFATICRMKRERDEAAKELDRAYAMMDLMVNRLENLVDDVEEVEDAESVEDNIKIEGLAGKVYLDNVLKDRTKGGLVENSLDYHSILESIKSILGIDNDNDIIPAITDLKKDLKEADNMFFKLTDFVNSGG